MKKGFLFALALMLCFNVVGQQSITLRSVDKAECVSSDFQLLRASFSFSTIEAENVETERGQFSWLSMPNTVIGGNEGDPQIPVVNELIAVPFGATPSVSKSRATPPPTTASTTLASKPWCRVNLRCARTRGQRKYLLYTMRMLIKLAGCVQNPWPGSA